MKREMDMLCIIDYSKNEDSWRKGKAFFDHVHEIKEKNMKMFQNMIKNINDYKWYSMAEKFGGNWPHPHEYVVKILSLGIIESSEQFLWLPELNLFMFKIDNEEEKNIIKQTIPNVEIYE